MTFDLNAIADATDGVGPLRLRAVWAGGQRLDAFLDGLGAAAVGGGEVAAVPRCALDHIPSAALARNPSSFSAIATRNR